MGRLTGSIGLVSLLFAIGAANADTPHQGSPVMLPGGIADQKGKTGYFTNARGGVTAKDLLKGRVLWTTSKARKPLAASGRLLLARGLSKKANEFKVLAFDTSQKAKVVMESKPIRFPQWVVVESDRDKIPGA